MATEAEVPPSSTQPTAPPQPPATGAAPGAGAGAAPHANITFTFPIFFITNPPHAEGESTDDNGTTPQENPFPAMWARFLESIRFDPSQPGQYEPMPSGPPKKHATQSALDHLRRVEVSTLPESDRRCNICMQDYLVKKDGPRSPYVETVRDEQDTDVRQKSTGLTVQDPVEQVIPEATKDESEVPLKMPCGHIFGSSCLKEWLYQSPTCPLCRVEVESYTDEPEFGFPLFENAFPWIHVHPPSEEPRVSTAPAPAAPSDEMQVDPPESAPSDPRPTQPNIPQNFPSLAFQFIFTAPPNPPNTATTSSSTSSSTPTPTVSRPTSSHTIRHHPYARTPTPSPLNPSPSVTDRPDLFCAQRGSGLCDHDITDESLIRLECGHAFHPDCLEGSMLVAGYPIDQDDRRCPRCRRWMAVLH